MIRIALLLAGFGLPAFSSPASAHEKWFFDASLHPTQWEAVLRPSALAAIAAALVLTALAWVSWRARSGRD